jgi:TolB-like protein
LNRGTEHRRLAAIMFTDMVGYSALSQRNEALALELLEEHRRIVRGILPRHAGREVKTTGDGFLVEFPSALAAVQCAVEIQRTLAERNQGQPAERQVRLRIGIHVGDVVAREGDVHGDGVNIAARIEPLSEPGGICLSRAVFEQVQGKLAEPMESAGQMDLKNLARPVEVFRVELRSSREDLTRESQIANHESQMERSLAVLPFVNMSDDRENEFLADGITEDLITALSRVKGLRVPARTSSFAFKGKNEDIRRIGQLLSVETVLEGSVRKSGNKLRVTAQLVKVRDGFHLWSERYDREMKDVFDIQDDITRAIVGALEVQLAGGSQTQFVQRQTASTRAYELYAQGRIYCDQRGPALRKAVHYFELALLEDPDYVLAFAGLAEALSMSCFHSLVSTQDAMRRARVAAETAVRLAPDLADGHAALGWVNTLYGWDWAGAEQCFRRANEINPRHPQGHFWYASLLGLLGRTKESLTVSVRGVEVDPLSPATNISVVWWTIYARRFTEALAQVQEVIARWPDWGVGHVIHADCLLLLDRAREAVPVAEKAVHLASRSPLSLIRLGRALLRADERERARDTLAELRQPCAPWVPAQHNIALLQWGLGDKEAAGASFRRAYEEREAVLPWLFNFPLNDELRGDPTFEELRCKLGLSP